jgi:hypothetical protein
MQHQVTNNTSKTTSFKLAKICFDKSDIVSVEAACTINHTLENTTLLFSFSVFNDLLRLGGLMSEKLQLAICDKLTSHEPTPYTIDITHDPLVFTNCALYLSMLLPSQNICYSVDDIMPLSIIQQAKYLKENIRNFNTCTLQKNDGLNNTLQEIANQYGYYKGLVELDITEECAREKAGLLNDTLFKIAYFASK